jgi:hypothetical protein
MKIATMQLRMAVNKPVPIPDKKRSGMDIRFNAPKRMKKRLGGISRPNCPEVTAKPDANGRSYPISTRIGTAIVPRMARVAALDPQMEPKKAAKKMVATARPPGKCPNMASMKSLRGDMLPLRRIRFPARIKKGHASSG